jgi:hypothetical protein
MSIESPSPALRRSSFICVRGASERVNSRPLQLWAAPLEKAGQCKDLGLHVFMQRAERQVKLIANLNDPNHHLQYVIKIICRQIHV